jgi:outer membrane biosynthesis protein TonB
MTPRTPLDSRKSPAGGDELRRAVRVSFAVHVAAVLILFLVPRDWLGQSKVPVPTMTISLGAAGPRTSGMNPAGARPIEEKAPPPKRPEPARPATPKNAPAAATLKTAKTPPKPAPDQPKPAQAPPRPPTTGAQVTPGTARAETGATGQGTGLAGGAGAGTSVDISAPDFCCPDYVDEMRRRILARWRRDQPEVGTVLLTFVIHRDGRFTELKTEKAPSPLLEYHARNAFNGLILPALPKEYSGATLTVRLTFNYTR